MTGFFHIDGCFRLAFRRPVVCILLVYGTQLGIGIIEEATMTQRHTTWIAGSITTFMMVSLLVLGGCSNNKSATDPATASTFSGGSAFGQSTAPSVSGNSGPGNPTDSLIPGGSTTPQANINGSATPAAGTKPLQAPANYNYGSLLNNLGNFGPFNPSKLPDPSFLNTLYCLTAQNYNLHSAV